MKIGVPKEIKTLEGRVGLTPEVVAMLARHGHDIVIETGAGEGIGLDDTAYLSAGASIARSAAEVLTGQR